MNAISDQQITEYVEAHIGTFHDKRLEALNKLRLANLLRRKNPYLFRSKNLVAVSDLIKSLLDAHLSSQEETLFGDFLEGLAIYVAEQVHTGLKSSATGIDLEFVKDGARYIVSIKSGPNWGNSSQVARMKENFSTAARVIRQGNASTNVVAVNGCCYGRDENPDKGDYFKYCGQDFWALISNDIHFYTRIIEPLGHQAKLRNDDFDKRYGAVINRLCAEFTQRFCDQTGAINWRELVSFSSSAHQRPLPRAQINKISDTDTICDILSSWGHPDLADRLAYFASDEDLDDGDVPVTLASAQGFLAFFGAVETDGEIRMTCTQEGWICAEWDFTDHRDAGLWFLDADRIMFSATGRDGKFINIRGGSKIAARRVIMRKLAAEGLFVCR